MGANRFDLAEIQHEIKDDPIDAIEKKRRVLNRKFDMQRRQIEEDIQRTVRREGDRSFAVTAVHMIECRSGVSYLHSLYNG